MGAQVIVPVARGVEVNARLEAHLLIDVRTPGGIPRRAYSRLRPYAVGEYGAFRPSAQN